MKMLFLLKIRRDIKSSTRLELTIHLNNCSNFVASLQEDEIAGDPSWLYTVHARRFICALFILF